MPEATGTGPEADLPSREIWVDERYESYARFFDHDWAKRFLDLAQPTKLAPAALDLSADWKGAASTASMPWLLIDSLVNLSKGFMQTHEPFWKRLTKAFSDHISSRMRDSISNMKRKELARIIQTLGEGVEAEMRQRPPELSAQEAWEGYLKIAEFRLTIWSTQRICYGAIYHAYENFLRRVIGIQKPQREGVPTSLLTVCEDLDQVLGKGTSEVFLRDPGIELARTVRNALAHNGGHSSQGLLATNADILVREGVIQILSPDVRQLFDLLKEKTLCLAQKAASDTGFRISEESPGS